MGVEGKPRGFHIGRRTDVLKRRPADTDIGGETVEFGDHDPGAGLGWQLTLHRPKLVELVLILWAQPGHLGERDVWRKLNAPNPARSARLAVVLRSGGRAPGTISRGMEYTEVYIETSRSEASQSSPPRSHGRSCSTTQSAGDTSVINSTPGASHASTNPM